MRLTKKSFGTQIAVTKIDFLDPFFFLLGGATARIETGEEVQRRDPNNQQNQHKYRNVCYAFVIQFRFLGELKLHKPFIC